MESNVTDRPSLVDFSTPNEMRERGRWLQNPKYFMHHPQSFESDAEST
jgi:hypothetical protein